MPRVTCIVIMFAGTVTVKGPDLPDQAPVKSDGRESTCRFLGAVE